MSTSVPMFSLGALIASDSTPLKERIQREGRLSELRRQSAQGVPWASNIVPTSMTMQQLDDGLQHLANMLYSPEAFDERMVRFIETFGRALAGRRRRAGRTSRRCATSTSNACRCRSTCGAWAKQSAACGRASGPQRPRGRRRSRSSRALFVQYAQVRHMFDVGQYWEPHLAVKPFWPTSTTESRWSTVVYGATPAARDSKREMKRRSGMGDAAPPLIHPATAGKPAVDSRVRAGVARAPHRSRAARARSDPRRICRGSG